MALNSLYLSQVFRRRMQFAHTGFCLLHRSGALQPGEEERERSLTWAEGMTTCLHVM